MPDEAAILPEPEQEARGTPALAGDLEDLGREIIHATRSWIQYGIVGFAITCIVIGAVEGVLGR